MHVRASRRKCDAFIFARMVARTTTAFGVTALRTSSSMCPGRRSLHERRPTHREDVTVSGAICLVEGLTAVSLASKGRVACSK